MSPKNFAVPRKIRINVRDKNQLVRVTIKSVQDYDWTLLSLNIA